MYVMNGGNLPKVHHQVSQPETITSIALENQSLKADNEQLRTRLDSKMFEVTKLRNKLKDMGSELESYKHLVSQIRTQFANCNGNQQCKLHPSPVLSLVRHSLSLCIHRVCSRCPPACFITTTFLHWTHFLFIVTHKHTRGTTGLSISLLFILWSPPHPVSY